MTTQLSKAQQKRVAKMADAVTDTLDELFSDELHAKRIESLGNATIGLLGSADRAFVRHEAASNQRVQVPSG